MRLHFPLQEPPYVPTSSSLYHRPLRWRMGYPGAAHPPGHTRRPAPQRGDAGDPQRHLLRAAQWVCLAPAAPRVSSLVHRVSLLPELAECWQLGADAHGAARAPAPDGRTPRDFKCGDHRRQPTGEGLTTTTAPKSSVAGNGICWPIPPAYSSKSWSMPQITRTAHVATHSLQLQSLL